jgi:serine/threonine-protein kinase
VIDGAYRVTRLIAEGGMAAVYEAIQLRLNKRVAIKFLARRLSADQKALARFRRETEITSHLGHPHLVAVIDHGQSATGEPYLVMEYLDGEDLDHRLRRVRRLPIEAVVHLVRQVASALGAAHAQGIVHRDLKPANIFLLQLPGEPDFVKVLDFGISKMMAAHTRLTNAAHAVGTPAYMSPEQATGMVDDIDHHIDQWALACIAWEMLLGAPPFVAEDRTELLYQVIRMEPQPLASRVPGLAATVEPVLRRALHKRPADRFPSIRDFSHAFESAAFGRPADATPPPVLVSAQVEPNPGGNVPPPGSESFPARPRPRIRPIHAGVVVVLGLLLFGAFWLRRPGLASAPATKNADIPVISPLPSSPPLPQTVPVVAAPEATAGKPIDPAPEPARAKRAKATTSPDTAGREKVKQRAAPFEPTKVKRQLIQQL